MRDVATIVAARQRERLARALGRRRQSSRTTARPSPWRHVPLDELFGAHNTIYPRGDGLLECGHEPLHTSKGGHCVLVDTAAGRWWCRSCRQQGDAATLIKAFNGWSYAEAAQWLEERYGPPARRPSRPRHTERTCSYTRVDRAPARAYVPVERAATRAYVPVSGDAS